MLTYNPTTLKDVIKTIDDINCPVCNFVLQKIEMTVKQCDECYTCIQDDRPFNMGRTNRGECSCEWYDKDITEITCSQCIENQIKEKKEREDDEKERKYMSFIGNWNSGINGKLSCYGIKKLQKLAKYKEIKGYSKLTKEQLIIILEKIVKESDFPIH